MGDPGSFKFLWFGLSVFIRVHGSFELVALSLSLSLSVSLFPCFSCLLGLCMLRASESKISCCEFGAKQDESHHGNTHKPVEKKMLLRPDLGFVRV